jgi:hypothetical protein
MALPPGRLVASRRRRQGTPPPRHAGGARRGRVGASLRLVAAAADRRRAARPRRARAAAAAADRTVRAPARRGQAARISQGLEGGAVHQHHRPRAGLARAVDDGDHLPRLPGHALARRPAQLRVSVRTRRLDRERGRGGDRLHPGLDRPVGRDRSQPPLGRARDRALRRGGDRRLPALAARTARHTRRRRDRLRHLDRRRRVAREDAGAAAAEPDRADHGRAPARRRHRLLGVLPLRHARPGPGRRGAGGGGAGGDGRDAADHLHGRDHRRGRPRDAPAREHRLRPDPRAGNGGRRPRQPRRLDHVRPRVHADLLAPPLLAGPHRPAEEGSAADAHRHRAAPRRRGRDEPAADCDPDDPDRRPGVARRGRACAGSSASSAATSRSAP